MRQLKTSSSILAVIAVAAAALVVTGYLNLREEIRRHHDAIGSLEERLGAAENSLQQLEPVRRLITEGPPRMDAPDAYAASQATGEPNAHGNRMDSPLAWCPARENGGAEWLELEYPEPIDAAQIRIHANYAPSAVVRVCSVDDGGAESEVWSGGQPVDQLSFDPPRTLQRVRLHLDTSKVAGWNEIDAVELVDARGTSHWATRASASSEWKSGP